MRGEKMQSTYLLTSIQGSPPHARGKATSIGQYEEWGGITPACAGKRASQPYAARSAGDHPRMRGEKYFPAISLPPFLGSPPHARGKVW